MQAEIQLNLFLSNIKKDIKMVYFYKTINYKNRYLKILKILYNETRSTAN